MLPRLEWEDEAIAGLQAIYDYIVEDNPDAARKLASEIKHEINQLPYNPKIYPPWRQPGTRKMVVRKKYIVIYAEAPGLVRILHVKHGAMRFFN